MPSSDFVATIVAGGQRYTNWKSVMVRRDYGNWQSVFQFTAAEPVRSSNGWATIKLKPGDAVQVYLGADKVIDGSITTREVSFDDKSHDLVIAGKSLTQNLESSVKIQPGTYDGSTFEQAARSVLGPTGVKLVIKNPPAIAGKPFKSLAVQLGESAGEFVERIARMRGFFLTDDENGNLVASQVQAGSPVGELQEGRNILRAVGKLDNQAAFSALSVVGQQTGDDQNYPPRDISATVTNPGSTSTKTRIIVAEHPGDAEEMQARVNFEAAYAAWGQVDCSITVVGWHKDDGSLWIPTENVTVLSPSIFPSESGAVQLGIQACIYAQDSQNGTTTTLELKLPQALTTLPSPFDGQTSFSGPTADPVTGSKPNAAKVDAPDTSGGQPPQSAA